MILVFPAGDTLSDPLPEPLRNPSRIQSLLRFLLTQFKLFAPCLHFLFSEFELLGLDLKKAFYEARIGGLGRPFLLNRNFFFVEDGEIRHVRAVGCFFVFSLFELLR